MNAPIPNGDGTYTWIDLRDQYEWYDYFSKYADAFKNDDLMAKYFNTVIRGVPGLRDRYEHWLLEQQAYANVRSGENPNDSLQSFAQAGITPNQGFSDWLSNAQSQYNTQQQQAYETMMRDTSVTSTGNQLQGLGLSPSNVIQVGGASSGVNSAAADTIRPNAASLKQQENINRYNQQLGLAKNLISTAGSMASSGIYGAALGAVKQSARAVAGASAHSGLAALKATKMSADDDAQWAAFQKFAKKNERAWNRRSLI